MLYKEWAIFTVETNILLFPLGIDKRQCKFLNYKEGEIGAFLH